MSSDSWPPQLKDWVAKCLGQMTDTNRIEAQAELRQVIADAFAAHTLWTTDWAGVQLKSLLPKPTPVFNSLKRKNLDNPNVNKKAKKALKNTGTGSHLIDIADQTAINRRAERFQREHELEKTKHLRISNGTSTPKNNYHSAQLYKNSRSVTPYGTNDQPEGDPNVIDWDADTIVGTSKEIFKDYLRLTSEPKPETIRPLPILQQTLKELKSRWRERCPYNWICSQFKSLRQDLTVQRIKNDFTVQVYEIHARMALESSDMVEYNQCQATLKVLYELGITGKVEEFTAYRILMLLHGRNRSELNLFVGQLTARQKADPAVRHALAVQRALAMGNYHSLFELYVTAPNMGAYIMDHFIDRERVKALMIMTKAYKTIPLTFLQNELAFDNLEITKDFLKNHSALYFSNPKVPDSQKALDCKPATAQLVTIFEEKYRKVLIKGAI